MELVGYEESWDSTVQVATFTPKRESDLIVGAIRKGLGLSDFSIDPPACIEELSGIGKSTGLTPWLLEIAAVSDREADMQLATYTAISEFVIATQAQAAAEVCSALAANKIQAAVFKGLSIRELRAGLAPLSNDVDILIPLAEVNNSKVVMRKCGFSQNVINAEGRLTLMSEDVISKFEATHYELFPFSKVIRAEVLDGFVKIAHYLDLAHPILIENNEVYVVVEIDVHHNLSHEIDPKPILEEAEAVEILGTEFRRLSWETQCWFIAARLYHEVMVFGSRKARPLVDIGTILSSTNLTWPSIVKTSKQYALSPSLYYPLCWLREQDESWVDENALLEIDCDRTEQSLHDFGDFFPKMLGESILLRPRRIWER